MYDDTVIASELLSHGASIKSHDREVDISLFDATVFDSHSAWRLLAVHQETDLEATDEDGLDVVYFADAFAGLETLNLVATY